MIGFLRWLKASLGQKDCWEELLDSVETQVRAETGLVNGLNFHAEVGKRLVLMFQQRDKSDILALRAHLAGCLEGECDSRPINAWVPLVVVIIASVLTPMLNKYDVGILTTSISGLLALLVIGIAARRSEHVSRKRICELKKMLLIVEALSGNCESGFPDTDK